MKNINLDEAIQCAKEDNHFSKLTTLFLNNLNKELTNV